MAFLKPVWDVIKGFVVKTFWPWFKEHALPRLKEYFIEIFCKILRSFKEEILRYIDELFRNRAKRAEDRATAAEKQAGESATKGEKEKYEALAKVWREVAEEMRQENEDLKAKLDTIETTHEMKLRQQISQVDVDLEIDDQSSRLAIGGTKHELRQLPDGRNATRYTRIG